jgi:hypothetical protein
VNAGVFCLDCQTELVLHQPDPDLPDRLLGTCVKCKSWFLIEAAEGVLVPLTATRA